MRSTVTSQYARQSSTRAANGKLGKVMLIAVACKAVTDAEGWCGTVNLEEKVSGLIGPMSK